VASNSLVGSTANDYVAVSMAWPSSTMATTWYAVPIGTLARQPMSAVTWGDGAKGVSGAVSAANSLIGSTSGDQVGFLTPEGVTALGNRQLRGDKPMWSMGR